MFIIVDREDMVLKRMKTIMKSPQMIPWYHASERLCNTTRRCLDGS